MTVSAPAQSSSGTMDVNEFTAFLKTRPKDERWHLIEGVAVMMNPPTLAHQRIADNLKNLLNQAFAARGLDLYAYQEISVRAPGVGNFQPRPDVAVFPGVAGYELYTERFQLAAEVLSPSNTRTEIGLKLKRYCEAPENLYVVIIDSRRIFVDIHGRGCDWRAQRLTAATDIIECPEFGLRCALGELYYGTPLDPRRTS